MRRSIPPSCVYTKYEAPCSEEAIDLALHKNWKERGETASLPLPKVYKRLQTVYVLNDSLNVCIDFPDLCPHSDVSRQRAADSKDQLHQLVFATTDPN